MHQRDIRAAIRGFLDLLEYGAGDGQAALRALAQVLDHLALAYHFAGDESGDGQPPDPPAPDPARLRQLAMARFPTLGYYNVPSSIAGQIMVAPMQAGDAMDDVADIARDMAEVIWRWEHNSEADALWHFRWGYENHWGEHLRNLQRYLYALEHESGA